jgi:hypothetical protein
VNAGPSALGNQREAASQVIAGAAVEPHALAILAGDNPEAIVLDLCSRCRPPRPGDPWKSRNVVLNMIRCH